MVQPKFWIRLGSVCTGNGKFWCVGQGCVAEMNGSQNNVVKRTKIQTCFWFVCLIFELTNIQAQQGSCVINDETSKIRRETVE